jgi:hypothetical protein
MPLCQQKPSHFEARVVRTAIFCIHKVLFKVKIFNKETAQIITTCIIYLVKVQISSKHRGSNLQMLRVKLRQIWKKLGHFKDKNFFLHFTFYFLDPYLASGKKTFKKLSRITHKISKFDALLAKKVKIF